MRKAKLREGPMALPENRPPKSITSTTLDAGYLRRPRTQVHLVSAVVLPLSLNIPLAALLFSFFLILYARRTDELKNIEHWAEDAVQG
jgi:hypothetical protein